jgi:hypothetical protein
VSSVTGAAARPPLIGLTGLQRGTPCAFHEAFAEAAFPPQSVLHPPHASVVALVIVADQVQEPMKRQHAKLGPLGMMSLASLTPRNAAGNDDVS